MTEHELQAALVPHWLAHGVRAGDERLFLAAWEVMSDYGVNDASVRWNLPSIDFLLLDSHGHMVALEIKPVIAAPKSCWSVLCQVTHRAQLLADGFRPELPAAAHRAAWSGAHGRVPVTDGVDDLDDAARRFFADDGWSLAALPVRRMVAATRIGPRFASIRDDFVRDPERARAAVSGYAPTTEFARFLALTTRPGSVAAGIDAFELPTL